MLNDAQSPTLTKTKHLHLLALLEHKVERQHFNRFVLGVQECDLAHPWLCDDDLSFIKHDHLAYSVLELMLKYYPPIFLTENQCLSSDSSQHQQHKGT